MRLLLPLLVVLSACDKPEDETTPKPKEDNLEACLSVSQEGRVPCLRFAKNGEEVRECVQASQLKIHACRRMFTDLDPTEIVWDPEDDYEWLNDPNVPKTHIPCPYEQFGKGWKKLQEENSLGSICVRNDITGSVY